jgi:hypothetical protein
MVFHRFKFQPEHTLQKGFSKRLMAETDLSLWLLTIVALALFLLAGSFRASQSNWETKATQFITQRYF